MKKSYLILAVAAALFAGCSSDSNDLAEKQTAKNEPLAIGFDTYVNRGTTRAGATGQINAVATLQAAATDGFGVFGFYTNADNYDQTFTPNFMYNQHVTYSSGWTYTPIKYWPNEFGTIAQSDDVDKVSFFAYAPYVNVNVATGKVTDPDENTWGIVGMKNNNTVGDPMVKYISTFWVDKQVDLLWGTQTGTWNIKNGGTAQTFTAGLPWLNVQHPQGTGVAQRLTFDFKHALASLNVQVDTKTDAKTTENPVSPASGSKVFIRSVTFEGFDTKGALNLNNATAGTALWYNFNCADELNNGSEITIKDGRKDGKEGLTAATKEYVGINPVFIQNAVWGSTNNGVTATPLNLFCKENPSILLNTAGETTMPIYVIPNGDKLKVTIEYDVLTADNNLAGTLNDGATKGSVIKNVITRYITTDGSADYDGTGNKTITLANGKQYTITLHLGLNSVQFDAAVTPWDTSANNGSANLPHNQE